MQRYTIQIFTTILILLATSQTGYAKAKYLFKICSLAPTGSVWVQQFENFADEVKEKSGGEVDFRIYTGGVMGDDQAMYRKMRVGQLHGGGFTMTGIARIVPDFRVMAIPFLFESYEEVDHVTKGLMPAFINKFDEKNLELVAMTEVGFIYAMSTEPITTLKALRNSSNWSPSGDPVSEVFLTTIGVSPIMLTIPDVLSSLQSGMIDTVYNSLYGSIILQWFTKAKFITDVPFGYAYGVFLLDGKAFGRLPDRYKTLIHNAAARHFPVLLEKTRVSNHESRQVLKERGTEFVKADPDTILELRKQRDIAVEKLVKNDFSADIYQKATELLEEFRKK